MDKLRIVLPERDSHEIAGATVCSYRDTKSRSGLRLAHGISLNDKSLMDELSSQSLKKIKSYNRYIVLQ